jgi:hypothetical protein
MDSVLYSVSSGVNSLALGILALCLYGCEHLSTSFRQRLQFVDYVFGHQQCLQYSPGLPSFTTHLVSTFTSFQLSLMCFIDLCASTL